MTQIPNNKTGRNVAIVGRPNVGKSSLFNRLVGKRIAIVHEEEGVTRDRLVGTAQWNNERFEVIDTAGLDLHRLNAEDLEHNIAAGMVRQATTAISDASAIILVTDLKAGVLASDESIIEMLRKSGCPTFIAANKADNEMLDNNATEFERSGMPVFPISALHGRGISELIENVLRVLPPYEESASQERLKVAIAGKPNAGKSSFINRLIRDDRLVVSDIPGTTRDSVDIPFDIGKGPAARRYLLTDTAGIKKKGKISDTLDRLGLARAERSIRKADVVVLLLDAEQGPANMDKRIAAMIRDYGKGCVIAVNKWDKVKDFTQRQYEPALRDALPFLDYVPIVFISAKTGFNIKRAMELVDLVGSQTNFKIPTGTLNRAITRAYETKAPPAAAGKRLKIFYATQTGTSPIIVTLFVNDTRRLLPAYRAYLQKTIRNAFGLEGAPIVIKARSRPSSEKFKLK
ncbi:MAG: ribosome biogenesis GTPase Der [Lentisphaerae bacterium]|nr:ribosome biogenesis GTPase Der [Lentisphaerota bacterium]